MSSETEGFRIWLDLFIESYTSEEYLPEHLAISNAYNG